MDVGGPADPFARRPQKWDPAGHLSGPQAEARAAQALAAAERGLVQSDELLSAAGDREELNRRLSALSLLDPAGRFALLYALQAAGQLIAEGPTRAAVLADESLDRLGREPASRGEAERLVPLGALTAQSHLLAGQSGNWTGRFDEAGRHFAEAYRLFGESTGDLFSLAEVEYCESQRRSFCGRADEGLGLARRARRTFEALGIEDYRARAEAAEANALFFLGRPQEALELYRRSLAVFEHQELWSNYVGLINSIGECLLKVGEPDEARRMYAMALRRVSREKEPAWVAFIRHGLANALFAAGRYREAAGSFGRAARLNRELGLLANALTAALFEIESWARAGDMPRAGHRLELWLQEVSSLDVLDPSLVRAVQSALSGEDPDLSAVAELRREIEGTLQERFKEKRIS
jgi:tetratricopeptide (TPR) repeat protein